MKGNIKDTLIQLIKFAAVGILNSIICVGTFIMLSYAKLHYVPAYLIGFSLSVVNAYYWNNKYVFTATEEKCTGWKVFCKTYMAYSTGLAINLLMLFLWMDVVRIEKYFVDVSVSITEMGLAGATPRFVAKCFVSIVDMMVTVPINFFMNKLWAFNRK